MLVKGTPDGDKVYFLVHNDEWRAVLLFSTIILLDTSGIVCMYM